ncbi:MAG: AAA family ATPase [Blastocatellia bacterium]
MRKRKETPFSTSPNPAQLYLTPGLKAAIHKVKYTIENHRGLTAILGDVGMGKSSLLRLIFNDYAAQEDVEARLIPTASFPSDFGLVKAISGSYGIGPKKSRYEQEQAFNGYLVKQYEEGKLVVLLIDESQLLSTKMLEVIRTLMNFESDESKLIQIVLAGQIELRDKLLEPSKKAIRSRIFAPSILQPLTLSETGAMLEFRCERAEVPSPITEETLTRIYDLTAGVPRDVLRLCDLAYDLMKLNDEKVFTVELLEFATKEADL